MLLHLLTLLLILPVVSSLHNITIDDTSSAIIYSPPASWTRSAPSTLDVGRSHSLTKDQAAFATFAFTGVPYIIPSSSTPHPTLTRGRNLLYGSALAISCQHRCVPGFWPHCPPRSHRSWSTSQWRSRNCGITRYLGSFGSIQRSSFPCRVRRHRSTVWYRGCLDVWPSIYLNLSWD